MEPINTIIAIINLCLLIFYILFKEKIRFLWQLFTSGRKKIILRIKDQKYTLRCLRRDLRLIKNFEYIEMYDTTIKSHKREGRLYLHVIVQSRDLHKQIKEAFYDQISVDFIDRANNKFEMTIAHLSKDGLKSTLTLVGKKELQNDQAPEESTLEINTIYNEDSFIKVLGQSLRKIDNNVWRIIYKDKIKPNED